MDLRLLPCIRYPDVDEKLVLIIILWLDKMMLTSLYLTSTRE